MVPLALPLGDGVEDDGGEVGHQVRRLPAQGRQVPHPRAPCAALVGSRFRSGRQARGARSPSPCFSSSDAAGAKPNLLSRERSSSSSSAGDFG